MNIEQKLDSWKVIIGYVKRRQVAMRNIIKIQTVILISITILTLLTGCSNDKATKESNKAKIGLSLPLKNERFMKDKDAIEAEAKKLDIDLLTQITDNNSTEQAAQCDELLKQGISVLILSPCDGKASAAIVEKAHAAGVKVISYDRLILDSDVELYMSFDNEKVGELQAQYLINKVPSGNYVLLSGDPNDNNAILFKKGAMKILQPLADKGTIQIVYDQACDKWSRQLAVDHTTTALNQNSNIQAILSATDGLSDAIVEVLAAHGLAGKIPLTGQDAKITAVKRIVDGTQDMTIFKDTRELGRAAVSAAIKLSKGESPTTNGKINNNKMDIPSILLPPDVVDKSNIIQMLVYSGYLKKGDI